MSVNLELWGTLGPACNDEYTLGQMYEKGMTGIRLNLSHVDLMESVDLVEICGKAAAKAGKSPGLVIDLQGPELRVGPLKSPVALAPGETIGLGEGGIPLPADLFSLLGPGDELLFDDGAILVRIQAAGALQAQGVVVHGGVLHAKKNVAIAGRSVPLPPLTHRDLENLKVAKQFGVSAVLQPFCTGKEDLLSVRQQMERFGLGDVKLVAKIENQDGVSAVKDIACHADEICIARGDLGNSMPLWELPGAQRSIGNACREAGCPFGVATQLLHSMQQFPIPTRGEVSDIFHAVADGASTLILTGETAVGSYPVQAMEYLYRTAMSAQKYLEQ